MASFSSAAVSGAIAIGLLVGLFFGVLLGYGLWGPWADRHHEDA